jgi:hypothetical protein
MGYIQSGPVSEKVITFVNLGKLFKTTTKPEVLEEKIEKSRKFF